MTEYICFDRQSDAQASLDEFCYCLERVSKDDSAWKYAIISIHSALQGYICICLRNGDSFQTWNERNIKKWLAAYRSNTDLPNTRLDFFLELYEKAFSDETRINRDAIEWINEQRNSLVHFNTDSLSIHRESAVACCKQAFEAIKLTPVKAKGIFFYDDSQSQAFGQSCERAEKLLALL